MSKSNIPLWMLKKRATNPVPIEQRFASPIVARHMAEIARQNEELRRWRQERMGKRIVRQPINLKF